MEAHTTITYAAAAGRMSKHTPQSHQSQRNQQRPRSPCWQACSSLTHPLVCSSKHDMPGSTYLMAQGQKPEQKLCGGQAARRCR